MKLPALVLRRWPLAALLLLAVVFSLMLLFSRKAPIITDLEPAMAAPGETVVITGDYFGRTAREGQLTISGLTPPPSVIQEWSDQKIVFQVPPDAPSGLVTVSNSQGVSSSVLFTNTLMIPTVLKTRAVSAPLEVTYVLPSNPLPGQSITLGGRGLGRGDSGSWITLSNTGQPDDAVSVTVQADETDSWSDQAVTLRLPAGWGPSSWVSVHTARGQSPAFPLRAAGPVTLDSPRVLDLVLPVSLEVKSGFGTINLVPPLPQEGLPLAWELVGKPQLRWTGVGVGKLSSTLRVRVTTFAHTWAGWAAGQILPDEVSTADGSPAALDASWKAQAAGLKLLAAKWGLETPDPLTRAKRLLAGLALTYHRGSPEAEATSAASTVMAAKTLTPLEAALLTSALGRQYNLTVRVVRGLYVDAAKLRPHAWVQAWIPGAAWLDLDPWLALDAPDGDLDKSFGNLDNRHVPWSTAVVSPGRQEPKSTPILGEVPFSHQVFLAEQTGNLDILAPRWETPQIKNSTP